MTWFTQTIFTLSPIALAVLLFASACVGWIIYGLRGYKHWFKRFHRYQRVPTRRQMKRSYGYLEYIPEVVNQPIRPLPQALPPQVIHKTAPAPTKVPVAPVYSTKDDLQVIEGIGPKVEDTLNQNGIYTWRELSQTPPQNVKVMIKRSGLIMQDPTTWSQQAHMANTGNWEELKRYQDQLREGRV